MIYVLILVYLIAESTTSEGNVSSGSGGVVGSGHHGNSTTTTSSPRSHGNNNSSEFNQPPMCTEACSVQYLSYCEGYRYPIDEELGLSIQCYDDKLQGMDRHAVQFINSAIDGQWKNLTSIFQGLLAVNSPSNETFPEQYFSPTTTFINTLRGHRMSPQCNDTYIPLKEMICSWLFVSPCHPEFRVCQSSCSRLIEQCFPTLLQESGARTVLDFICYALSSNDTDTCQLPEEVYSEDGSPAHRKNNSETMTITIISVSVASTVILFVVIVVIAIRHFLYNNGYVSTDISIKMNLMGAREIRDRAREIIRNKADLFPGLGASDRSLADRSLCSVNSVPFKKRPLVAGVPASNNFSAVYNKSPRKAIRDSQQSLDQYDCYSLNSSASTFYCQTNQSVSTIGEVLPPETINFEGILSSRWKCTDDEVIALVSWIDGIGNRKKGVIKCYTDKKRKLMEDELNVISHLSHDNICEYLWRSLGNRPQIRGMTSRIQGIIELRNNYFCTDYYNYGSLKDFLSSNGHFLKDTAAHAFLKDIVSGMAYLHDLEVFHRDLKTANILVGSRSGSGFTAGGGGSKASSYPVRLVISDFGHSQDKDRQDCFVRDGSGGTSQYTAPEVLLSTGTERIDLYKADVYSMALVLWEILSYICCKHNENANPNRLDIRQVSQKTDNILRCQIQNHTAFGAYLINRFPDLTSTSTRSCVVREYMRNMYRNNIQFRPPVSGFWSSISPTVKSLVILTRRMWQTKPSERPNSGQLARLLKVAGGCGTRYSSQQSLNCMVRADNAI